MVVALQSGLESTFVVTSGLVLHIDSILNKLIFILLFLYLSEVVSSMCRGVATRAYLLTYFTGTCCAGCSGVGAGFIKCFENRIHIVSEADFNK